MSELIDTFLDPRKRIAVLLRSSVELAIINAHAPGVIVLLDEEDWGAPRRGALSNETLIKQISDLCGLFVNLPC